LLKKIRNLMGFQIREPTDIDGEGRKRNATKSNDAEVPEYLRHEHLFEDGDRMWSEPPKRGLPLAAKVLHKAMLKFR
jgi:hypothetical protein